MGRIKSIDMSTAKGKFEHEMGRQDPNNLLAVLVSEEGMIGIQQKDEIFCVMSVTEAEAVVDAFKKAIIGAKEILSEGRGKVDA